MHKSDQRKRHRRASSSDSDNDRSRSKKIFADGYDEEYRGDADDRAWLNTLSEREREAELLKRHDQREILNHREEISKKLKSKNEDSKVQSDDDDETDNDKKTKSSGFDNDIYAEDDEDDYHLSANRRKQANAFKQKETQHSKSLQALIEERKKKQDEKQKKSLPKPRNLSSSDDDSDGKPSELIRKEKLTVADVYEQSGSDNDDDEEEEDDRRQRRSRSPDSRDKRIQEQLESKRKKCTPITSKSQLKSMVLSRFRMEKWCHAPFFSKVVKGAFVRINIGQNNGMPVYRVCEIQDVVETGKTYNLGATRTNKGLRLKHGHNERVFRLEFVSNSELSDSEFRRWRETTLKQGIALPTLDHLEKKIKDIETYKHYVYSNRDITAMVKEKSRFRKVPTNYAVTKNELMKDIDIAKDDNDIEREAEIRKKLDEMEQRASELDRKRTENISVMAQINQRNRQRTRENVEMALVREALENRNAASDPFTRRRCAPILVSKAPQTKEDLIRELHSRRAAEEEEAAKKKLEEQRLLAAKNNEKLATIPKPTTITQRALDKDILPENIISTMATHERGSFTLFAEKNDELFASHDFELDLTFKLLPD